MEKCEKCDKNAEIRIIIKRISVPLVPLEFIGACLKHAPGILRDDADKLDTTTTCPDCFGQKYTKTVFLEKVTCGKCNGKGRVPKDVCSEMPTT